MRMKRLSIVIVSALFFVGLLAGCVYSAKLDEQKALLVASVVRVYIGSEHSGFWKALGGILVTLAVPGVIAVGTILGLGIVVVPAVMLAAGFTLSVSLSAFILSMGKSAMLSAFFACGLPNLILLPCLFYFASEMLCIAMNRTEYSIVRAGNRESTLLRRQFLCAAAFLAGSLVRVFLTPFLLEKFI
jgi:hypothetical protein